MVGPFVLQMVVKYLSVLNQMPMDMSLNEWKSGSAAEVIDTFETELQFKPTPNFVGRTSVYYSSVTDKIDKASGLQPEKPLLGTDYYDNTKGTEVYGGEFYSDGDLKIFS